jgi:hypothetical protein
VYWKSRDNTLDFRNFKGLEWSIFVLLYTMKLLFCSLIEKIEAFEVGWFFFHRFIGNSKIEGEYVSLFKFICTVKILLYPKGQQNLNLLTKSFFNKLIIIESIYTCYRILAIHKKTKMINLVDQQLTKTLIHVGNLLCVYCGLRDNIIDFYNIKGLRWSILIFLYTMKLLFRHLIEKIESLDVEVFWSFHRLIDH